MDEALEVRVDLGGTLGVIPVSAKYSYIIDKRLLRAITLKDAKVNMDLNPEGQPVNAQEKESR